MAEDLQFGRWYQTRGDRFHMILLSSVLFTLPLLSSGQIPCQNTSECQPPLSICKDGKCGCISGTFGISKEELECLNSSVPDASCPITDCVYCPDDVTGVAICARCVDFLYESPDGIQFCYETCPSGTHQIINTFNEVVSRRYCSGVQATPAGDTNQTVLIAVVCVVGAILLITIISFLVFYGLMLYRQRRTRGFDPRTEESSGLTSQNVGFIDAPVKDNQKGNKYKDPQLVEISGHRQSVLISDERDYEMFAHGNHSEEMIAFLRKLDRLRKHSTDFLRMLNDMRRRLKELPVNSKAAISYKNVMSDITRLLFLLNKKPTNVEMPPDGMHLLDWSEQTLHHYLESQKRAMTRRKEVQERGQAETHF